MRQWRDLGPRPLHALLALGVSGCAFWVTPVRPWGSFLAANCEFSELDVVGDAAPDAVAGADPVVIARGRRVLVVQAGDAFPDEAFLEGLRGCLEVGAMSGVPTTPPRSAHGLRHVAQRGGFDAVLCTWAILESRSSSGPAATTDWEPVLMRYSAQDRVARELRVRLRIVVLDAASGRWRSLTPAPVQVEPSRAIGEQFDGLRAATRRAALDAILRHVVEA